MFWWKTVKSDCKRRSIQLKTVQSGLVTFWSFDIQIEISIKSEFIFRKTYLSSNYFLIKRYSYLKFKFEISN